MYIGMNYRASSSMKHNINITGSNRTCSPIENTTDRKFYYLFGRSFGNLLYVCTHVCLSRESFSFFTLTKEWNFLQWLELAWKT